ncbi:hypothetical protein CYANOKiyG1_34650 [Okeania sp. KiyG1]|nr:hypothetical protein CYANOKiyG1_34650 [Okeania sp. KiyG1]
MIVSSARRLSNLVNDILDFSKIKHHTLALDFKPVDVYGVVEAVVILNLLLSKKEKSQTNKCYSYKFTPCLC